MVSGSKPQKKVQDTHEAGEKLHEVKARTYGKERKMPEMETWWVNIKGFVFVLLMSYLKDNKLLLKKEQ